MVHDSATVMLAVFSAGLEIMSRQVLPNLNSLNIISNVILATVLRFSTPSLNAYRTFLRMLL